MPIDSIFLDPAFDKEKDSETSKFLLKILPWLGKHITNHKKAFLYHCDI